MGKDKIHFLNKAEDALVPSWNEAKREGFRMSKCGYQRRYTTREIHEVTCKICLREYFKK